MRRLVSRKMIFWRQSGFHSAFDMQLYEFFG